MSEFRKQIEKKARVECDYPIAEKVITIKDLFALLANYKCIPTKKLEEIVAMIDEQWPSIYEFEPCKSRCGRDVEAIVKKIKELLKESKKKEYCQICCSPGNCPVSQHEEKCINASK